MKKKWFTIIGLSVALAVISPAAVFADTAASATVTMDLAERIFRVASGRLWKWTRICHSSWRKYVDRI